MADDVTREVDQLLKEREKYEAWLEKLESQKPAASGRAYERVRADYQRRLDEVMDKLRAHSEAIHARLEEMEGRVAELEQERKEQAEKLDEARLRRSVGEYSDDKEWKKLEGELVAALEGSEKALEDVRAEIGRLQEIVALVDGARPKAEAAAASTEARAEAEPAPEPPRSVPAAETEPAVEKVKPAAEKRAAKKPEAAEEKTEPAAAAASAEADEGLVSLEELVLGDEELKEATAGTTASETGQEGGEDVGDELAFLESLSLGGNEDGDSFTFLEQRGTGTPQTIICPHCSAANDPAEWYCTECGEELPAE